MPNPEIVAALKLQSTQFVGELRKVRGDMKQFGNDVVTVGRYITAAFVSGAIIRGINNIAKIGDELAKMSARTGLSVEFLNGFTQAGALADVEAKQLSVGVAQLNKNLLDTVNGTGEAKDQLERFGIGSKEASALLKTPEEAIFRVTDLLSGIKDPSERGAVAMKLFGRSGVELLPLLNQGSDALRKQIAKLHEHRKITEADAKAAEEYNDSITSLGTAFEGLLQRGVGPILPALTELLKIMTALVGLDIDGFLQRLAAFTGVHNVFRGITSLALSLHTIIKDLTASIAFMLELIANPSNADVITREFEAIDREIREEAARRQSLLFPEATGGAPKDFKPIPSTQRSGTGGATTEGAATRTASEQTASLLKVREAELELLKVQEEIAQVSTDEQNKLKGYIVLLKENLAIQKEIEAAAKGNREIDPNVKIAAQLQARAELIELANQEVQRKADLNTLEQTALGLDVVATETQRQQLILLETRKRLAQENLNYEIRALDPLGDAGLLRGQEIIALRTKRELLLKENEILGATVDRKNELLVVEAKIQALQTQGQILTQEGIGRSIIKGAGVELDRKLEAFRRAVRDAEAEVQRGEALPNQLDETNQLRRIELKKAEIALIQEEQRYGIIGFEEANRRFSLADAQLRKETTDSQEGFATGWSRTFQEFEKDSRGAFGLGQTLARNFVTNIQNVTSSLVSNVFDKLTEGTLTWKSALSTIPDLLKQITSQLIGMLVARGIAGALGGGFSLGGGGGDGPFAGLAGQPGFAFATGGSFTVGGRYGTDANFVPLRLTRGEKVTVETEAQQRAAKGAGVKIDIHNYSGADVQVNERENLDGRVFDVIISRKVDQVIEKKYGTPRKPGRIG